MKLLDLFSGIGGFSLGLNRAGYETVAFCEIDPWCQRVLAKHWPGVPIYADIRELDAARLRADGVDRIDAICGGFPCQDVSLAGKGAGLDGERSGLWREFRRLIGELRPGAVYVENVGALRGRGLLRVLADLAALGYDAEWHSVPAAAIGAPHLRDRVWIVAVARADAHGSAGGPAWHAIGAAGCGAAEDAQQPRRLGGSQPGRAAADAQGSGRGQRSLEPCGPWPQPPGGFAADADRGSRQRKRKPQHGEQQGAPGSEPHGLGQGRRRHRPDASDSAGAGLPQLRGLFGRLAREIAAASAPWERSSESPLRGVDDGIPAGLDGPGRSRLAKLIRAQDRHRVKALGNAVVPLMTELLGRAVLGK